LLVLVLRLRAKLALGIQICDEEAALGDHRCGRRL